MLDNPYVSGPQLEGLREMIQAHFKLSVSVIALDADLVGQFASAVCFSAQGLVRGDLESASAVLFEFSQIIAALTEPSSEIPSTCGNPECTAPHAIEAAYLEASTRGDTEAAMNVVKAMIKDANRRDEDPHMELCRLYASVIMLMAEKLREALTSRGEGDADL